ncbi:SAM-dependent methyltransferase [Nocardia rhizosphaerihabitans]|uniref:SAM-dependent methyltransferase n=1 Tax=Nocardia rhizosphaerihabitans TaxID=1691570 RepID=UPI003672F3E2
MAGHDIELDQHVPSSARVGNKLLGGKDNYEIDQLVASNVSSKLVAAVGEARRFLLRAVECLTIEHTVHQYVDLGCGIPLPPDVGDVAGHNLDSARTLYLDNDPLVAAHARALLATSPNRHFALLDITDTTAVLNKIADFLDLNAPISICLSGTAEHLPDAPDVLAELAHGLPPGTWIVFSHITADVFGDQIRRSAFGLEHSGITYRPRDHDTVTAMLTPYRLLQPGLIAPHRWRPDTGNLAHQPQYLAKWDLSAYAAVGQLPH